jgi:hypothetical protein
MDHLTLRRGLPTLFPAGLLFTALLTIGCASPGPPRAPSLHLPQRVTDLAATRSGNTVELRFTVPRLSTDKLPLYNSHGANHILRGTLCREMDHHDCVAVTGISVPLTTADRNVFTLKDSLPGQLTSGTPHLIGYRVEFYGPDGRSAGKSEPAYTASGPIPPPVTGLHAAGTRGGILLQWEPSNQAQSEVVLKRTELSPRPKPAKPESPPSTGTHRQHASGSGKVPSSRKDVDDVWLNANSTADETLDDSVTADEPYCYIAVRRALVSVGTNTFDLRSDPSEPVEFTLHAVYAPSAPTGITATGFQPADSPASAFAVDLIWQPVDDHASPPLAPPLVGYNIYREELAGDGSIYASRARLNATPVPLPAFHDATAKPTARYRYSVTAIDANGNESKAATFTLEPSPQ